MKKPLPNYQQNEDTFNTQRLQQFEADRSAIPLGHKARPRPVDRPRIVPSLEELAAEVARESLQAFGDKDQAAPGGIEPSPKTDSQ